MFIANSLMLKRLIDYETTSRLNTSEVAKQSQIVSAISMEIFPPFSSIDVKQFERDNDQK